MLLVRQAREPVAASPKSVDYHGTAASPGQSARTSTTVIQDRREIGFSVARGIGSVAIASLLVISLAGCGGKSETQKASDALAAGVATLSSDRTVQDLEA